MNNKYLPIAKPYFEKNEISKILSQYKKILKGEGLMTMGKYVKKFEDNFSYFMKTKYSVATSSCTSALEIAVHSLNLKKDDQIIIPAQTFIATASCVIRNNLKPVICEIDENFQMDINDLKNKVNSKTKAVIIVHYAGYITKDIFKIKNFLKKKKIKLIEDCAHAIGSSRNNIYAGNFGDIACFSFYSTKNLTTGEGGMLICKKKKLYDKIKAYRSRGLNYNSKIEEYSELGTNSRMTEFQAILGIHQLNRIQKITNKRNEIASNYNKLLFKNIKQKNIEQFYLKEKNSINAFWKYPVKIVKNIDRKKLKIEMNKHNIAIDWAYSPLVHKQKIVKKIIGNKKLKNSEKFVKKFFCLPMHLHLSYKDQKYICKKLLDFLI